MNGLIFILFYFVLGKVELGRKFLFHACKERSLSSSFLTRECVSLNELCVINTNLLMKSTSLVNFYRVVN